jgi:hypothetical protein
LYEIDNSTNLIKTTYKTIQRVIFFLIIIKLSIVLI